MKSKIVFQFGVCFLALAYSLFFENCSTTEQTLKMSKRILPREFYFETGTANATFENAFAKVVSDSLDIKKSSESQFHFYLTNRLIKDTTKILVGLMRIDNPEGTQIVVPLELLPTDAIILLSHIPRANLKSEQPLRIFQSLRDPFQTR